MSLSANLQARLDVFKASFAAWAKGELVVVEAVGAAMLTGLEAIAVAAKPTAVADITAILEALPAEFLSGSTLDGIAEEVLKAAKADTAAALESVAPQVLATLVGVLIKAL